MSRIVKVAINLRDHKLVEDVAIKLGATVQREIGRELVLRFKHLFGLVRINEAGQLRYDEDDDTEILDRLASEYFIEEKKREARKYGYSTHERIMENGDRLLEFELEAC